MSEATFKQPPASHPTDPLTERRTLRDYVIILRERLWIALPLAILVAVGFGYRQAQKPQIFQSVATLEIEKPDRIVTTEGVVDQRITSDIELNTHLLVFNSSRLRSKVAASLTPDERKIIQEAYAQSETGEIEAASIEGRLGEVSATSAKNSFIIRVTARHRSPAAAQLLANRFVDQFMRHLDESVSGKNEYAVESLQTRAEQLRKEAELADQRLQDYMRQHNLVSLDNSVNIVADRLKAVNGALQSARLDRLSVEELVNQIEGYRRDGRNLLEIAAIAAHGTVPNARSQLAELQREQARLSERYLERHPAMIDLANSIAAANAHLDRAIQLAIADIKASLEKARANEKSLEQEYVAHERQQLKLRDLAVEFRSLENQALNAKKNYSDILERRSQTATSSKLERIPIRPLDSAGPGGLVEPRIKDIVQTSIGLGVLVFLGVAFGLSFIDDRIKSAWDVESFIGVTLLGIVPDLSDLKDDDKYSLVLRNKEAPGVESFLSVYSSVKIHSKVDYPKSILVTSTIPGEGKTLISCNLAESFARHGKRTLLIDCDLRRPMLHRHFNQPNERGLINWFDHGASFEGDITANPHLGIMRLGENFSVMCSGGRSKSPTQLLETPLFGQLIDRLKKHYDLIVVDSPPMGAVTDSLLIAERTDEVVYVCRFNRALRKHIKVYIRALHNGKNEILGIVLNGMSTRRIEYYSNYRYYRSYKKYYGTQA